MSHLEIQGIITNFVFNISLFESAQTNPDEFFANPDLELETGEREVLVKCATSIPQGTDHQTALGQFFICVTSDLGIEIDTSAITQNNSSNNGNGPHNGFIWSQ